MLLGLIHVGPATQVMTSLMLHMSHGFHSLNVFFFPLARQTCRSLGGAGGERLARCAMYTGEALSDFIEFLKLWKI